MGNPRSFSSLEQINVENIDTVSGAVIWTHNLHIMGLLPSPLDVGIQSYLNKCF